MKSILIHGWHVLLMLAVVVAVGGCPLGITPPPSNQTGQPLPGDCFSEGGGGTALPAGELYYPMEGVVVGTGDVPLLWTASDVDGDNLAVTIYVSNQEAVFDNPIYTEVVCLREQSLLTAGSVRLLNAGNYYWGIEIADGENTSRRPVSGLGEPFEVSEAGTNRLGMQDAVLFCPNELQPARARTTFQWALGEAIVPVRTQVFVGRPGRDNPFDSVLYVLDDVTPPTATSWTMPEGNSLPMGEPLSWGLRIETAEQVLFGVDGQGGVEFVVGENVPPTGNLLSPADESTWADGVSSFLLAWEADVGNCEDELSSTIYFEQLVSAGQPAALFESAIQLTAGVGALETNLASASNPLDLAAGRWAWGVIADDGMDEAALARSEGSSQFHGTFIRNTAPRFDDGPRVQRAACSAGDPQRDAIVFTYSDGNGAETVTATISFAASAGAVFDDPAAELTLPPSHVGGPMTVPLLYADGLTCPIFSNGGGVYGIELDDGVNAPVREIVEYPSATTGACCYSNGSCSEGSSTDCVGGSYKGDLTTCATADCTPAPPPPPPPVPGPTPDCNNNDVLDADDIAAETSDDCNENDVPDECDIANGTSDDCDSSGVPDECEDLFMRFGDLDFSGIIDLGDVPGLNACMTTPCEAPPCLPVLYGEPCCILADLDHGDAPGDGDVDLVDYALFQLIFGDD